MALFALRVRFPREALYLAWAELPVSQGRATHDLERRILFIDVLHVRKLRLDGQRRRQLDGEVSQYSEITQLLCNAAFRDLAPRTAVVDV